MRRFRIGGFTLVELMVTIAIVAILVAVALPSFQSSLRSNRVATAVNELISSLSLARSEALRNPGGAVICTSTDGTGCDGDWSDGWIVWIDVDGDDVIDAGDDRILRYFVTNDNITLSATAAAASPTRIRFDARGRVSDNIRRDFALQPAECSAGQPFLRELALTPTGQVQLDKADCT